jgi:hypothetical protein
MDKVVLRTVAVAAVLTAVTATPAAAQDFGGGTLSRATKPRGFQPIVAIGLQQRGDRMAFRFETTLKCGDIVQAEIGRREVPLTGGRFRAKRSSIHRLNSDGGRVLYSWRLRGRSDGTFVTGRVRITGVMYLDGRRMPCTRKPVRRFRARVTAPTPPGAPRPAGGAAFGGTSDFVTTGLRGPVMLRVSGDGKRVGAIWAMRTRCAKGAGEGFVNISPAARIKADGSFSRPERFWQYFRDARIRYTVAFSGRFSGDGAAGSFHVTARWYDRKGKHLKTTCDSGLHAWSAARLR